MISKAMIKPIEDEVNMEDPDKEVSGMVFLEKKGRELTKEESNEIYKNIKNKVV